MKTQKFEITGKLTRIGALEQHESKIGSVPFYTKKNNRGNGRDLPSDRPCNPSW